jgi:hypothetical protein
MALRTWFNRSLKSQRTPSQIESIDETVPKAMPKRASQIKASVGTSSAKRSKIAKARRTDEAEATKTPKAAINAQSLRFQASRLTSCDNAFAISNRSPMRKV